MHTRFSYLALAIATLISSGSIANKELWQHVANVNWESLHRSLLDSTTAREDLLWTNKPNPNSIRDLLLDYRKAIKLRNGELYDALFAENGLIGWLSVDENSNIDEFINAAKIQAIFKYQLKGDAPKLLRNYRKLLANTFSTEEIKELVSIYQDADFQLLVDLLERSQIQNKPGSFALSHTRRLVLDPFISALEIFLPRSAFATTLLDDDEYPSILCIVSELLSEFSDDRVVALTQKLVLPAYRREVTKRWNFISDHTH